MDNQLWFVEYERGGTGYRLLRPAELWALMYAGTILSAVRVPV